MKIKIEQETHSPEALQDLAQQLWREQLAGKFPSPIIVTLEGELGAGKTSFVQGLGKALGIEEPITSPSYTYVSEYKFGEGKEAGTLVHVDAWRVKDAETAKLLDLEKYVRPQHIVVIEWPQNLPNWKFELSRSTLVEVKIEVTSEGRLVNITSQ